MKWMLIVFLGTLSAFGCTGDCMTCHPALLKNIDSDKRHKPMITCIQCHSANPAKMADCGSDCFACHPVAKIEGVRVAEHAVIRECRDCHMKLKTTLNLNNGPTGQSVAPTLRDFLQP
ncbi:hypothetical protein [Sulfuricurvum sp.]|uniref:hypothetical protein n=1 Tax=Sulfuricurvum sp. TaxID=2025608 RepID=UPI003C620034